MKNLVKKSMVPAFASALLILAAGQAQAVSVSVMPDTHAGVIAVNDWFVDQGATSMSTDASLLDYMGLRAGGGAELHENFESMATGWYESLNTGVGTIVATGLPGTGATAEGGDVALFEIRDYDENGRFNVYPWGIGTQYLDSADVSELTLTLDDRNYENLFFTLTDPSDQGAVTTASAYVGGSGATGTIDNQSDGSLWFVGVAGDGETLDPITLATTYGLSVGDSLVEYNTDIFNGNFFSNDHTGDGFGVDSIGTVNSSVPEPATALLLGAGLLPLMGFLRRKKEDEM